MKAVEQQDWNGIKDMYDEFKTKKQRHMEIINSVGMGKK